MVDVYMFILLSYPMGEIGEIYNKYKGIQGVRLGFNPILCFVVGEKPIQNPSLSD